jgi:hypothetical protein
VSDPTLQSVEGGNVHRCVLNSRLEIDAREKGHLKQVHTA